MAFCLLCLLEVTSMLEVLSPLATEEQVTVPSQAALRTSGCSKSKYFQHRACIFYKCMHPLSTSLAAVSLEWELRFDSFGYYALHWFVVVYLAYTSNSEPRNNIQLLTGIGDCSLIPQ